MINVHAPIEEDVDIVKDLFYKELEKLSDKLPSHNIKLVIGNTNAKIGKERAYWTTTEKESLHEETNENGMKLISFTIFKNMNICSTNFLHKVIYKQTQISPNRHKKTN